MSKTNNRIPCPINEGADLNSQFLMEALFDDMDYVERETKLYHHVAMGWCPRYRDMALRKIYYPYPYGTTYNDGRCGVIPQDIARASDRRAGGARNIR